MNKTFNAIKVMAEAAKVFMDTLETQEQKDAFRALILATAQAINTARNESVAIAERAEKYCIANVVRELWPEDNAEQQ
jgi:hypothetical protein